MRDLMRRCRNGVPKPHLQAKGAENVCGEERWLDNNDIRPLKLSDRTWGMGTYLTFWWSAVATVSNWYGASSAQALGLSMWESVACTLGGQIVIATIIVLNGRAGAKYHIGFPILNRASFGVYGAWWPTFNRAVMAVVWNGVNGVQGGQCIYVMLHALTPRIANLKNIMGEGSSIDSGNFIGCVIFWIITCFFLVIPVPKMRGLVYAKLIVFVISAISMLAWTATKAGGIGIVARQSGTATGSIKHWLIVRFFFLGAANCATFASNAADFQRYAKKPGHVILGNIIGFPISNLVVSIVGNIVGASSQVIFGEVIWNPVTFLDMLQTTSYTSANRAGCFFIAACFAYSAVFSSIFENSLPAGNDIAALFPKFLTVRRGFFICAAVSFAINPWYLLGSASIFISFLSSYQIFLSAITGVLLCHYYIITRGYLEIDDLYTARKDGVYYYAHGWNWRAYTAYIIAIAPNFYGFLNNMGVTAPLGVTRAYYVAYEIGVCLSFFTYWGLNYCFPPALKFPLNEWHEPKDYVRPGDGERVIEGRTVQPLEKVEEIDPTNPNNNQEGRTILITDAGTGLGLVIAAAFGAAGADLVILTGRRLHVLLHAIATFKQLLPEPDATQFRAYTCDFEDARDIKTLWESLARDRTSVTTLIVGSKDGGLVNDEPDVISEGMTNILGGNITMSARFKRQGPVEGKVILNISSMTIHQSHVPVPACSASKAAFALMMQGWTTFTPAEQMLLLIVHPGLVLGSSMKERDNVEEPLPWDDANLTGAFSVWATKQNVLHGRYVWCNWDSTRLKRTCDPQNSCLLKLGIQGTEVGFKKLFDEAREGIDALWPGEGIVGASKEMRCSRGESTTRWATSFVLA